MQGDEDVYERKLGDGEWMSTDGNSGNHYIIIVTLGLRIRPRGAHASHGHGVHLPRIDS